MQQGVTLKKDITFARASLVPLIAVGAEIFFQLIVAFIPLSEVARVWTIIVGNQIVFFGTCLIAVPLQGSSLAALTGVKKPPKAKLFPLFVIIAVLCVFAFAPLASFTAKGLKALGYTYTPQYFIPYDNIGAFIPALLSLSFLPAVGEETLMRGVLLSGAKKKSPVFALFFTALAFALFHGNLVHIVHQFLLGLVMGYLVLITRSIYASATVHCVNNIFAILIDCFYIHEIIGTRAYGYFTTDFSAGLGVGAFIAVFLGSMLLLAALLVLVTLFIKREREKEGVPRCEKKGFAALLAYFSSSPEEVGEESNEKQDAAGYLPFLLLGVLLVLLLSNVLSEVIK